MKSVSNNEWREVGMIFCKGRKSAERTLINKIIARLGYTSMLDYYLVVCEN